VAAQARAGLKSAGSITTPRAWWYRVTVVAGIAAGVGLRIWLVILPTGTLDSDEAVVGLMARHIVHQHQFTTFYWGQNYGGSITAVVMAAGFAVFGSSTTTLKAVPVGMSAVSAVLVWRLGRRTIGEPGATIAALAFWVWPTNYVWLSTKERGFYWACMILGLAFLLAVLRLVERPERWRDWIALGLLGGLGWWTSPQILYFAVPGLVWLAFRLRREVWRLAVAFPFAVIGSLPWLVWNARHHWAALVPTSHQFDDGYVGNIKVLFRHGLPVALGLNAAEHWIVPVVFPAIYIGIVVLGTLAVAVRRSKPWLLVLAVVAFPLLWGAFPVSGVIGEGRYVLFILPAVVLLLMYAARSPVVQVILLVAAFGVSVDGVHRIRCCTEPFAPDVAMPRHTGPLIHALEAHHVTHFDGDYWIVYRVAFETDERIVGAPRTTQRWPPYDREVAADPDPPAVFVARSAFVATYRRGLARLGVSFTSYRAGDFVVYQPAHKVGLDRVLAAGRST
jgi:Dolichyl-phosphate-mannose-protein mannosyltransferase